MSAGSADRADLAGLAGLAQLARRMEEVAGRVGALAQVVTLVAADLDRTEAEVAGLFASGPMAPMALVDFRAVSSVLATMDPAALEALLVGSPEVASLVLDAQGMLPAGSAAAALDAVLRSGEPRTVVLRQAFSLLSGLSVAARQLLALLHPALVSGLVSAPVSDRCLATRVLVSAEIARLRGRVAAARGAAKAAGEQRLHWYAELLGGVVTLVHPDGSRLVRPHQLLTFDPRGDGRVMEVFGDLTTARHLAVYVPGTGTSLDRYPGNAERASSFAAGASDLAVVLWQNADFPDQPLDDVVPQISLWGRPVGAVQSQLRGHIVSAAFRDAADRAGGQLARDVEGLRMAVSGADLTVLGHSYGGSIVGSAEAHGMVADRIVHIASAGGYVSDVRDYVAGECGTRRFSMTAPEDPIQLAQGAGLGSAAQAARTVRSVAGTLPLPLKPLAVPIVGAAAVVAGNPLQLGHGLDPDLIPSVTRLDTGLRTDGRSLVTGHGGMFEPGSDAWRNLLAVMRDEPVRVLEPQRWGQRLVPAGPGLPHLMVTRSPYDGSGGIGGAEGSGGAGYVPPVQAADTPVCRGPGSW